MRRLTLALLFLALSAPGWAQTRIVTADVVALDSSNRDVQLQRMTAAVLALVNGTTAQEFRVYGTTSGSKYLSALHNGTNAIINATSGALYLRAGGQGFYVAVGGSLYADTDSAYNIGSSTGYRPQSIFAAIGTQVGGATTHGAVKTIRGDATKTGYVGWHKADDTRLGYMGFSDTNMVLQLENSADFNLLGGGAASRFFVDYDGNVGIGTAAPTTFKLQAAGDVGPNANWSYDLASDALRWRSLYAAELNVWQLVARTVIASIGGEIWTSDTTKLSVALGSGAGDTTLTVADNFLEDGDFVILKDLTSIEVLEVDSAAGGSAGAYTYTVVRDKDGTGRNAWAAGVAVVSTGKAAGEGFISQYASTSAADDLLATPLTLVGPALMGVTRTGTSWNSLAPRWVVGNLNGAYGYSANTYGLAAGDVAETWFAIDATNGFRFMHGAAEKVVIDENGDASFSGSITSTSGTIGGWSLAANRLYALSGTSRVGLDSSGSYPVIYAGNEDPDLAPFRVLKNGALYTGRSYFGSTTGMDVEVGHSGDVNLVRGLDGATERLNLWWSPGAGGRITAPYSSKSAGYSAGLNFVIGGDGMTSFGVTTNIDTSTGTGNLLLGAGLQLYGAAGPTGGDKGVGTINVTGGFYENGTKIENFPGGSGDDVQIDETGSDSYTLSFNDGLFQGVSTRPRKPNPQIVALQTQVADLLARIAALEAALGAR